MSKQEQVIFIKGVRVDGPLPSSFDLDHFLGFISDLKPNDGGKEFNWQGQVFTNGRAYNIEYSNPHQRITFARHESAPMYFDSGRGVYTSNRPPLLDRVKNIFRR